MSAVSLGLIAFEASIMFVFFPLLFAWLGPRYLFLIIPVLIVSAVYCNTQSPTRSAVATVNASAVGGWTRMLQRFALGALLSAGIFYLINPDDFMSLPRERLQLWLLVMVLYPVLSALPQELIYRRFLFSRCEALGLNSCFAMCGVSTLVFGFAHIVFSNWQAVAMSLIGGLIFSDTYCRSRSLRLVWAEHALWGNWIFTIGLGKYLMGGTVSGLLAVKLS